MINKQKKNLINIVKLYFNNSNLKLNLNSFDFKKLDQLICQTQMNGIAYLVLKDKKEIPIDFLNILKNRFEITKKLIKI